MQNFYCWMRKNRADLSKSLTNMQSQTQFSSKFLFTDNLTLVSYVPKPRKCVILLSSMHHEHNISGPDNSYKPKMILYYNTTKKVN